MAETERFNKDSRASRRGGGLSLGTIVSLVVLSSVAGLASPLLLDRWMPLVGEQQGRGVPRAQGRDIAFVPFGEIVVNLDDGRLSRYLRVNVTLQVSRNDSTLVEKRIGEKHAILRDWIVGNLSDKTMDDIRGAAGQNRVRREIHDQFNTILFPDGPDRIQEILFEEFNVQ